MASAPPVGSPQAPPFMSGPPAPFGPPPPHSGTIGSRPGTVTAAAALLLGYVAVALLTALVRAYFTFSRELSSWIDYFLPASGLVFDLVAIVLAVAAAGLIVMRRDAGRALAFGLCGYVCIAGCNGLLVSTAFMLRSPTHLEFLRVLELFAVVVMLCLTAAAFVLLLTPRAANWFREQGAAKP